MALLQSPVHWQWQHICGHQDQNKPTSDLTHLETLNIQMDAKAKQWWEKATQDNHQPMPTIIPGEGWSLFLIGLFYLDPF